MNKEKLKNLINKSQRQFLVENNEQITHTARNLINYLNKGKDAEYDALYQFLHRVKGTAGSIDLPDISLAASDIENLMIEKKEHLVNNDMYISEMVKGIGTLIDLIEQRLSEVLIEDPEADSFPVQDIDNNLIAGKILVVDDDVSMLNYMQEILKNEGFDVYLSSNAEEAVNYIKRGTMDLAIIDIVMPEKSGLDIYKEIKKNNIKIPIIFMTGLSNNDVRLEALQQGAEIYLKKPINIEELIARVNGMITKVKMIEDHDNRDDLTKAFTRKHFVKRFEKERQNYLSNGEVFSVAFLDLDNFKTINDTQGHLFGDHILISFVETIVKHLDRTNAVFRFGGDEFLVLFPGTSGDEAEKIILNVKSDINSMGFDSPNSKDRLTISFSSGIAEFNDSNQTKTSLLENADKALYVAKEHGKNQVVLQSEAVSPSKNKILVVDDEKLLANIIKTRLGYLGYEVDYAKDGQEALVKLNENTYDLILLDIMLPKVTGIEVLKRYRNSSKTTNSNIIMISGKHSDAAVMESLKLGADDFLKKPFSLDVLEHKIKKILTT